MRRYDIYSLPREDARKIYDVSFCGLTLGGCLSYFSTTKADDASLNVWCKLLKSIERGTRVFVNISSTHFRLQSILSGRLTRTSRLPRPS